MISINQSIEKSNIPYTPPLCTRTVLYFIGASEMREGNWLFVVVAFIALVLLTIGVIDWLVGWFWLVGGPGDYHGFDHLGFWMRGSRALIDGLSFPSFFS